MRLSFQTSFFIWFLGMYGGKIHVFTLQRYCPSSSTVACNTALNVLWRCSFYAMTRFAHKYSSWSHTITLRICMISWVGITTLNTILIILIAMGWHPLVAGGPDFQRVLVDLKSWAYDWHPCSIGMLKIVVTALVLMGKSLIKHILPTITCTGFFIFWINSNFATRK